MKNQMDSSSPALERMVELWNLPPNERLYPGDRRLAYCRNRKVTPENVKETLLRDYSLDEITSQIHGFLRGLAAGFRSGDVPGRREMFLAGCCLSLLRAENGIALPKESIMEIVRSFPSIIFYFPVGKLIKIYLSDREVLAALYEGVTQHESDDNVASCLEGIRLYKGLGRPDTARGQTSSLVSQFRRILGELAKSNVALVRETAKSAAKQIGFYDQ